MRLTLDKAWKICLSMWEDIHKDGNVDINKIQWMAEHGYEGKFRGDCPFCEYAKRACSAAVARNDYEPLDKWWCDYCPGRKVDKTFGCHNKKYHHFNKPKAFYKKLLELDRIRRGK